MKKTFNPYLSRPIRFLGVFKNGNWYIKLYSISVFSEFVSEINIEAAKLNLTSWLDESQATDYETYQIANLIIHEFRDGVFAIVHWWIDENMLQNYVYLRPNGDEEFKLFSNTGINTCVWEMAIWWHERNAWVKHILRQNTQPDFEAYLQDGLSLNV